MISFWVVKIFFVVVGIISCSLVGLLFIRIWNVMFCERVLNCVKVVDVVICIVLLVLYLSEFVELGVLEILISCVMSVVVVNGFVLMIYSVNSSLMF